MNVKQFTFNDFQENTYLFYDETKEAIIFDPGCNSESERQELLSFLKENKLDLVGLINTHCHIDHVLGNKFISDHFDLKLQAHKGEVAVLQMQEMVANMYGIAYDKSPEIEVFLDQDQEVKFGNTSLQLFFTPGHSPASLSFFDKKSKQLIAGDVLFEGSIGRTDLPGGDFDTLIASIKDNFYDLGDDVIVYPGHGPSTTIGKEKKTNPFLVNA